MWHMAELMAQLVSGVSPELPDVKSSPDATKAPLTV